MHISRRMSIATWFLILLMVALVLINSGDVHAQVSDSRVFPDFKWEPVTEADWNLDLSWLDERPGAVMIFEKVIDDHQLLYWQTIQKREYVRTRIHGEEGMAAAAVEFTYNPNVDMIVELQARTILRDGQTFELSREEILAEERRIGEDGEDDEDGEARLVTFAFPGADADCIVEWSIGLKQEELGNLVPTYIDRPVQKNIPLILGEYTWFYASKKGPDNSYTDLGHYQYTWSGPYPDIVHSAGLGWLDNGITRIVRNVPAWRDEPMALPESATRLQLWRYYGQHPPEQALAKIAGSYWEPEPDSYDFGDKDKKAIHGAADRFRSISNSRETIRAVYAWLQDSIANTTYLRSPPEWLTGKRGKKIKKFASHKHLRDVLKKKYGTWRDIECLFYRLLRELGIEAMPTLVVGRHERLFNEKAGFFQFSRFVIAVKDSAGSLSYYAPGEYRMPFGKLHWSVEATDALLCDGSVGRTTYSPPEGNTVVRTLVLDLRRDGSIVGKLTERHGGHKGRVCHVRAVGGEPEGLKEYLADSLKSLVPGASGTIDTVVMDSTGGTKVEVHYSLSYGSLPDARDSLLEIRPLLYAPDTGNVFTASKRHGEIVFGYAYRALDTVVVSLSGRYQVNGLPADSTVVTDAGYCNVSFASDSASIVVVREFVLERPRFSADEYAAVQVLFAARAAFTHLPVALKPRD